jgi:phage shock protein C
MGKLDSFFLSRGIYRNTAKGWIAGICAGLADFIGVRPRWVRIAFIILSMITHGFAIIAYIALVFIMKKSAGGVSAGAVKWSEGIRPENMFADRYASFTAPQATPASRLIELKTRFTALDARLSRIEATITSDELSLRRKFRDLGA